MILDDELLEQALRASRDQTLDALPPESEMDHVFSDNFDRQMQELLGEAKKQQHRPFWRKPAFTRRVAAVLVVGFVGFSACFMSVDAWREKLFRMVEQKHPEYSEIVYEPVESASGKVRAADMPEFKLVEYRPSYLPEGYRLTSQMLDEAVNWSNYSNAEGKGISFDQSILGVPSVSINTEGGNLEQFDLNGDTAFKMDNRGSQFVLWNDEQYQYMVITNEMTMDEAVKIAASVTVCPPSAPHPPKLAIPDWDIPEVYNAEQAAANGDVVVSNGEIVNMNVLDTFLNEMEKGNQAIIRVTDFDKGGPVVTELYFDGFKGNTTVDNGRTPGQPKNHTEGRTYDRLERVTENGEIIVTGIDNVGARTEILRGKTAQP